MMFMNRNDFLMFATGMTVAIATMSVVIWIVIITLKCQRKATTAAEDDDNDDAKTICSEFDVENAAQGDRNCPLKDSVQTSTDTDDDDDDDSVTSIGSNNEEEQASPSDGDVFVEVV